MIRLSFALCSKCHGLGRLRRAIRSRLTLLLGRIPESVAKKWCRFKYACGPIAFAVHFDTDWNSGLFCDFLPRLPSWEANNPRPRRVVARQLVVKNDVQKRLVHTNAAVVFDEPQLAKAIHEEAYS